MAEKKEKNPQWNFPTIIEFRRSDFYRNAIKKLKKSMEEKFWDSKAKEWGTIKDLENQPWYSQLSEEDKMNARKAFVRKEENLDFNLKKEGAESASPDEKTTNYGNVKKWLGKITAPIWWGGKKTLLAGGSFIQKGPQLYRWSKQRAEEKKNEREARSAMEKKRKQEKIDEVITKARDIAQKIDSINSPQELQGLRQELNDEMIEYKRAKQVLQTLNSADLDWQLLAENDSNLSARIETAADNVSKIVAYHESQDILRKIEEVKKQLILDKTLDSFIWTREEREKIRNKKILETIDEATENGSVDVEMVGKYARENSLSLNRIYQEAEQDADSQNLDSNQEIRRRLTEIRKLLPQAKNVLMAKPPNGLFDEVGDSISLLSEERDFDLNQIILEIIQKVNEAKGAGKLKVTETDANDTNSGTGKIKISLSSEMDLREVHETAELVKQIIDEVDEMATTLKAELQEKTKEEFE